MPNSARENEFAGANKARMNAPKAHNSPYKCPACWGRGWTTHAAFSCGTCGGSGVNPDHRGR